MRQRLSVATALLGDPRLLVLDEPANGLDPEGIRWLRNFLRSFAAGGGTVFISSHVLAEIAQLADEVVIIGSQDDQSITVREMAEGALLHSHAHVALAVSGVAGPAGGTPEKPVGTVWFAWSLRNGDTRAQVHHLVGNRSEVRVQSVRIALQGVLELLDRLTETA